MDRLRISFVDTDEVVILDENCQITAWKNSKTQDRFVEELSLEFNKELPNILLQNPLMFYVYDDIPIIKLYRSIYIKQIDWIV